MRIVNAGDIIEYNLPSGETCLAAVYKKGKRSRQGDIRFDIVYVTGTSKGLTDTLFFPPGDMPETYICTCIPSEGSTG